MTFQIKVIYGGDTDETNKNVLLRSNSSRAPLIVNERDI